MFKLNTNPSQYYIVCFTLKWLKQENGETSKRFVMLIIYPFQVASLYNSVYHYCMCKCTPQCKQLKNLCVYNRITPKATLICRWGVFSLHYSFLSHVWLRIYGFGYYYYNYIVQYCLHTKQVHYTRYTGMCNFLLYEHILCIGIC